MSTAFAISVIVATRNRSTSLARLLDALADQVDAPPFEVIVADNGSTDGTPAILSRGQDGLVLRTVRVEEPGKGRALNAAIRAASAPLLVFTDDDVRPDRRWLVELHRAATCHLEIRIFGGRIEVEREAVPAWIRRSRDYMSLLTSEHGGEGPDGVYEFARYPFGPNMAIRREVIADLHAPYPEHLGPGTSLPIGDEGALFLALSPPEARDRLYVSTARVRHDLEPRYFTFSAALARAFQAGFSEGQIGLPPTSAAHGPPSYTARLRKMLARVRACASVREFICVCARQVGYIRGRRTRRRVSLERFTA